jgi:hypothetical protein
VDQIILESQLCDFALKSFFLWRIEKQAEDEIKTDATKYARDLKRIAFAPRRILSKLSESGLNLYFGFAMIQQR